MSNSLSFLNAFHLRSAEKKAGDAKVTGLFPPPRSDLVLTKILYIETIVEYSCDGSSRQPNPAIGGGGSSASSSSSSGSSNVRRTHV
jgi:hypothetical protein